MTLWSSDRPGKCSQTCQQKGDLLQQLHCTPPATPAPPSAFAQTDNNLPTTLSLTFTAPSPSFILTLSMSMAGQALHKLQNWEIMVEV